LIIEPYTLFGRIPLYRDNFGHYATDPLWEKDLTLHFRYIKNFKICCPVEQVEKHDESWSRIKNLSDRNVIALRRDHGWISVVRNLVPNALKVRSALAKTHIAHSGGAGWAFPVSYYILLIRIFLRFKWIIVIESSPFRMPARGQFSLRRFLSHHVHTFFLKRCVRSADARILTSKSFAEIFDCTDLTCFISPAVWVDQSNMISAEENDAWKQDGRDRTRFLFPARLNQDKGTQTVLDAIHLLEKRHVENEIPIPKVDIIGHGPLADRCRQFAANYPDDLTCFHEPLPYGPEFFAFLRGYDAIIVANLQDEQPRIIFDAYSQGLACISSETGGTRDLIDPGKTGSFFKAGDEVSLANRLAEYANSATVLRDMGSAALRKVSEHTHENMHRRREDFLKQSLGLSLECHGWSE